MTDFTTDDLNREARRWSTKLFPTGGVEILKAGYGNGNGRDKKGGFSSFPDALIKHWKDLGGGSLELLVALIVVSRVWIGVDPDEEQAKEGGYLFYEAVSSLAEQVGARQNSLGAALRTLQNRGFILQEGRQWNNNAIYRLAGLFNALHIQIRLKAGESAGDLLRPFGIELPDNVRLAATVAQINEHFSQAGYILDWATMKTRKSEKVVRTRRTVRTIVCDDCGDEFSTGAQKAKRCPKCRKTKNLARLIDAKNS